MADIQRQLLSLPEATIMTFAPPTLPGLGNASGFDLRILAQAGQSSAELEQVTREILQRRTSIRSWAGVYHLEQQRAAADPDGRPRPGGAAGCAGGADLQQPADGVRRHARQRFQPLTIVSIMW